MIYLESVGSYLDPKKGIIYPAKMIMAPDLDCPIDLIDDEASAEWYESLSNKDFVAVGKVINDLTGENV